MNQKQQHELINDVQRLYFELLRRVRYNLLDGESVVHDLLDWHDLWYSVIAARLPYPSTQENRLPIDLSLLRTTRWNDWPVDTLYIWTNDEAVSQLQCLIEEHWQASEIEVFLPEDVELINANLSDAHNRVLFVWWD
jgi:hypothetical protein